MKEAVSESGGVELRSPDPANPDPLKEAAAVAEFDATLPEKSAEEGAEDLALVSPQLSGEIFYQFLNLGVFLLSERLSLALC